VVLFEFLKEFYTLFFVWLTCLTAIFVYRKTLPFSYRWFAMLVILLSILETIGNVIAFSGIRDHFFFNIIFAIQLTFIPFFFKYWLHLQAVKKRIIPVFLFIFPLLILINTLWGQGFYTLQTYTYALGGSIVLLLSVAYLRELYTDEETQNIFYDPVFWLSIAFLIYFSVTVPFYSMLNYLLKNQLEFVAKYYLIIIDVTICLYNILLTTGFLCMKIKMK